MYRFLPLVLLGMVLVSCEPEDGAKNPAVLEVPVERPAFDGAAAHQLIRDQVAFGPRVPGTEGHAAQLAWMEGLLTAWADEIELQPLSFTTSQGVDLDLTNVLARFRPDLEDRILLLTHWDTRPRSDQAQELEDREIPVPGANDGGSGTAILLHLADLMSGHPPPLGVDLLFVDGEDYGPWTQDMFIGSNHFAATMPRPLPWRYGILLDMVGDLDPRFPIEGYSAEYAPLLAQKVWQLAHDLGFGPYFPASVGNRVLDDHLPLNKAGLPTIDIIDFEYGPGNILWHTPDDVPGNTSPETLRMVGEVVTELVYRGG
ncbi:MAG: M28 family peptidase [Longimicrobiales bacterium]